MFAVSFMHVVHGGEMHFDRELWDSILYGRSMPFGALVVTQTSIGAARNALMLILGWSMSRKASIASS